MVLWTEEAIKQRIIEIRDRGVSPVSINTWLRCIRAYFRWLGNPTKIPKLKEEQKVLATLNSEQTKRLLDFKSKGLNQTRTHTAALLILAGGYRMSEVLGLKPENCDLDNLVVKVKGKGNKHRLVPLSRNMRKVLYRYTIKHPGEFVFGTRNDTEMSVRNFQRDFKTLGKKVGITGVRFSPGTLRHSFAVGYLRAGGNLFYLPKFWVMPVSLLPRNIYRHWLSRISRQYTTISHF
jgi:site-specific recombinase XerD